MSDVVITVEGVSKSYLVGHRAARRDRHSTLRDAIAREAGNFARKAVDIVRGRQIVQGDEVEEFWALKDINFEIKRGEVLGIVGRNGAGKSTLLKILSRITEPTRGRIKLKGRVASLLEVGTGFHPELTGRENIFLNGAILGMTREEISKKFDEIVAFAEVERFLDTPVKRYSSGMYVRLAFAVAAHLEPEILIVDEVLAVGDAEFQKKCLGKMSQAAHDGRTILFVSHNMEAVDRLTNRCALLLQGEMAKIGPTATVLDHYINSTFTNNTCLKHFRTNYTDDVSFTELWLENSAGERISVLREGEPFRIVLTLKVLTDRPCDLAVVIEGAREQALFTTCLSDLDSPIQGSGAYKFGIEIEKPNLRHGSYLISLAGFSPDQRTQFDEVLHVPAFQITGATDQTFPTDARWGSMYLPLGWKQV